MAADEEPVDVLAGKIALLEAREESLRAEKELLMKRRDILKAEATGEASSGPSQIGILFTSRALLSFCFGVLSMGFVLEYFLHTGTVLQRPIDDMVGRTLLSPEDSGAGLKATERTMSCAAATRAVAESCRSTRARMAEALDDEVQTVGCGSPRLEGDSAHSYSYSYSYSYTPTIKPSAKPSAKPTMRPSAKPSAKSSTLPTLLPSASDTVTLSVELVVGASAAPTSDDETTIKTTVASETNVDESAIRDFTVSYTTSSRRLKVPKGKENIDVRFDAAGRNRLLTTYTWTVTFTIVVSLSSLDDDSITTSSEFSDKVSSTLGSDLLDALQDEGLPVTSVEVTVTVTSDDDADDTSGSHHDDGLLKGALGAAIAVPIAVLVCGVVAFSALRWRNERNYQKQSNELATAGHAQQFNVQAFTTPPESPKVEPDGVENPIFGEPSTSGMEANDEP